MTVKDSLEEVPIEKDVIPPFPSEEFIEKYFREKLVRPLTHYLLLKVLLFVALPIMRAVAHIPDKDCVERSRWNPLWWIPWFRFKVPLSIKKFRAGYDQYDQVRDAIVSQLQLRQALDMEFYTHEAADPELLDPIELPEPMYLCRAGKFTNEKRQELQEERLHTEWKEFSLLDLDGKAEAWLCCEFAAWLRDGGGYWRSQHGLFRFTTNNAGDVWLEAVPEALAVYKKRRAAEPKYERAVSVNDPQPDDF